MSLVDSKEVSVSVIIINKQTGRLIATYGVEAFRKAQGGGFLSDCINNFNKFNNLHKAVRI